MELIKMAIKQTAVQEYDFENMSLEEIEILEKQEQEKQVRIQQAKIAKIQASKKEAFDALLSVVSKFHLNGTDIINALLTNRKIKYKEIGEIKPIYLINSKVMKNKRGSTTGEKEQSDFLFYESKVILADAQQAKDICSSGVDSFKATLTEQGKMYLTQNETKNILIKFYNEYKPEQAQKWDGV